MSEVSCRAFTFFANAERAGVCRVDDLLAGLPFTRDQLSRPGERVAWDDWAVLTDRFAAAVGSEAALIDTCHFAIDEQFAGALARIAGMFAEPRLLYRVAMLWVASGLYRAVRFDVSEANDERLRITATLRPGYRESRAWFVLFAHGALLAPTFLGQPPATAESVRVDGRSAEVVIRTSRARASIWSRLRWRVRTAEVVAKELVTQQQDLTAAFEDMRRATSSFQSVIDALPVAIAVMRNGRIRYANPSLARLLGSDMASLRERSLQEFVAADDVRLVAALERGEGAGGRIRLTGAGPEAAVLDARAVTAAAFEGEPAVIVIGLDVSEEVRARAQLERSEATIRLLVSTHPELVARLDTSLRVLDVQPGQFTGDPSALASMVGRDVRNLVARAPSTLAAELTGALHEYEARMAAGQVFEHTLRMTAPDGRTREFQLRGTPVAGGSESILVVRDETERREVDRRLALSEHLASLGVLTAGVAHEINNPLTYVSLAADSLAGAVASAAPENAHLADLIAAVRDGTERIRSTVGRMKSMSRASSGARTTVSPRRAVEGALAIAGHETTQRARVVAELRDTRDVLADDTQLGQVFVNLLVNAAQALDACAPPDADGHTIRVRLFEESDSVIFECEDTGEGIAPERLGRVFDPFYTTKERRQGTGLGLAIVHQIVKDLGGSIDVRSAVGRGTTFRVTLPVASGAAPPEPIAAVPDGKAPPRVRIYVIDDEPMIGRLVQRALHEHDVVLHTSAEPALAALTAGDTPALLICDVEMPGLSGIDLFERVGALRPELRARFVFLTGGAFRERSAAFVERPDVRVVQKPLSMASLRQLVLDAGAPGPPPRREPGQSGSVQ